MTHDSDRLEAFDEHLQVEIEAEDEFRPMASGRVGIKIPLRTALVAVGMLLLGLVLFSVALDFYFTHPNHDGSGPFLILGTLTLIPGSYASWTIVTPPGASSYTVGFVFRLQKASWRTIDASVAAESRSMASAAWLGLG